MKVIITGSKEFNDYDLLYNELEKYKSKINLIISGDSEGADGLVSKYADDNKIEILIIPKDWDEYYKEILSKSDCVIAFWDGISPGTNQLIHLCEVYKKPYKVIYFE